MVNTTILLLIARDAATQIPWSSLNYLFIIQFTLCIVVGQRVCSFMVGFMMHFTMAFELGLPKCIVQGPGVLLNHLKELIIV
jgi:hypothetical protein